MDMTLLPSGMNKIVDEVRNNLKQLRANDPANMQKAQTEMAKLGEVIESFDTYKKTDLNLDSAPRDVELAADALDNIWRDDSPEQAREFIDDALAKLSSFSVSFTDQQAQDALRDLEFSYMEQEAEEFFEEFDSIDEARGR